MKRPDETDQNSFWWRVGETLASALVMYGSFAVLFWIVSQGETYTKFESMMIAGGIMVLERIRRDNVRRHRRRNGYDA